MSRVMGMAMDRLTERLVEEKARHKDEVLHIVEHGVHLSEEFWASKGIKVGDYIEASLNGPYWAGRPVAPVKVLALTILKSFDGTPAFNRIRFALTVQPQTKHLEDNRRYRETQITIDQIHTTFLSKEVKS